MTEQAPAIVIMNSPGSRQHALQFICYGVEEESIPWEIRDETGSSAVTLAYQAAQTSKLGVGIGIGSGGSIAVHLAGLRPETPLLESGSNPGDRELVSLGKNAARLVKGLPLDIE